MSVLLSASINALGGTIFGYNTGVIGPILQSSLVNDFNMSSFDEGILTSCILLGAMIGSLSGGLLADKIGRKKTTIIVSLLSAIGAIGSAFVPNFIFLCVVRAILGLGVGVCSVVLPMYVTEISPADKRGSLGTFFQIFITLSIFIAYLLGYALVGRVKNDFRILFGLGAIPALILFIISATIMPESPLWQSAPEEKQQILNNDLQSSRRGGWTLLFSNSSAKPLFLGIVLAITLQLTGINAIIYYAPKILSNNFNSVLLAANGIMAWNFVTTLISIALVERLGRRTLYLINLPLLCISNITLGFDYQFIDGPTQGYVAMVCFAIFILGFEAGPGSLFWISITELFPNSIRDEAVATINFLQWGCNLLLSLTFPVLTQSLGLGVVYWIFSGVGIVGTIIIFFLLA